MRNAPKPPAGRRALWPCACLLLVATATVAQVPNMISYQGKLLDSTGAPVGDGSYAMEFRFYDDCESGNLLLTDTHYAVQTADGIYSVLLGGGTLSAGVEAGLLAVFSNHDPVCLGVKIEDDDEMTPRQRIVSTGFALHAAVAEVTTGGVDDSDNVVWTGGHTFQNSTTIVDGASLAWPHTTGSPPPQANFRVTKFNGTPPGQSSHPNGENDEQWMICYNCQAENTEREDSTQHGWNQKIEATYHDGDGESLEYNWNYRSPTGDVYRPFNYRVWVDGPDANHGSFRFDAFEESGGTHLHVREDGYVGFSRGLDGQIQVDGTSNRPVEIGFRVNHTLNTDNLSDGPGAYAILLNNDFDSDTPGAHISQLQGVRSRNGLAGSADDRQVTGSIIAFDGWNELTQTGAGSPIASSVHGFRYRFDPIGTHIDIGESYGLMIEQPKALALVDPITIDEHFGVRIDDQRGFGANAGAALQIDSQDSNPSPSRGNLTLQGGGWNSGHLRLGDGHVWVDPSSSTLRFNDGAPGASGDGTPVHSPPGTDVNWGVIHWGNSNSADHDTGDEVCALAGLACKETYDMGATTVTTCASSTHSTASFQALCH